MIIFDLGGVLIFYDDIYYYSYLSKKYNISERDFYAAIQRYYPKLYKGKVSNTAVMKLMARKFGIPSRDLKPEKYFMQHAKLNRELIKFAIRLRHNYKVVILTNIYSGRYNSAMKLIDKKMFDEIISSCSIGMMKPDKNIYEYTLKKYNAKPEEAVFIDNLKENILGARNIGIKSILFKGNTLLFKKLLELQIKA